MLLKQSRRETQKRDRKERIYAAALTLFKEQGFYETTVIDIARAAGVSRGTVFNYYPYKEAMLLEHAASQLETLSAVTTECLQRGASPIQVLYGVFDQLAQYVEAHKTLVLPLSYELLNPDPARSRAAYQALPLTEVVSRILSQGTLQHSIREDFSKERLARMVANTYFLTALQWAAYRSDRSIREELRLALELTLEGILLR